MPVLLRQKQLQQPLAVSAFFTGVFVKILDNKHAPGALEQNNRSEVSESLIHVGTPRLVLLVLSSSQLSSAPTSLRFPFLQFNPLSWEQRHLRHSCWYIHWAKTQLGEPHLLAARGHCEHTLKKKKEIMSQQLPDRWWRRFLHQRFKQKLK